MTLPTSTSTQSRPESRLVLIPTSSAFTCLYRSRRGRAHPSVIPSPVIAPSFSSAHPGTQNPGPPGTDRNPNRTKEYDTSSKEFRTERQKQGPTRRPGRQEVKIRLQDSRGKPNNGRHEDRAEPNNSISKELRKDTQAKPGTRRHLARTGEGSTSGAKGRDRKSENHSREGRGPGERPKKPGTRETQGCHFPMAKLVPESA